MEKIPQPDSLRDGREDLSDEQLDHLIEVAQDGWDAQSRVDAETDMLYKSRLVQRVQNGEKALDQIAAKYDRLANYFATQLYNDRMALEKEDLAQAAREGLIDELHRINLDDLHEKGIRAQTVLTNRMGWEILRVISQESRVVRLPINKNNQIASIVKTERELTQRLGRVPDLDELAFEAGFTTDQAKDLRERGRRSETLPIDSGRGFDTSREFTDIDGRPRLKADLAEKLAAPGADPQEMLVEEGNLGLREDLDRLMEDLNPRERQVLAMRYLDDEKKTLDEVGQEFGVTRERVRQIESKALAKLRRANAMEKGRLSHYLDHWTTYLGDKYSSGEHNVSDSEVNTLTLDVARMGVGPQRKNIVFTSRYLITMAEELSADDILLICNRDRIEAFLDTSQSLHFEDPELSAQQRKEIVAALESSENYRFEVTRNVRHIMKLLGDRGVSLRLLREWREMLDVASPQQVFDYLRTATQFAGEPGSDGEHRKFHREQFLASLKPEDSSAHSADKQAGSNL